MSPKETRTTRVGTTLRSALESAARDGSRTVEGRNLTDMDLDGLATDTLEYLRSRPSKPSHLPGWQKLSARAAGVMNWWTEAASLNTADRRRLGPLRDDVYDVLEKQHLIEREPGKGSSMHISPARPEDSEPGSLTLLPQFAADMLGAWVFKAAPQVYDLNRVFDDPSRLVRRWAVDANDRSNVMQAGQPAYLWVGDGDPVREPGVWGVGQVTGPCVAGVADEGWLDLEAAHQATLFADVEIVLRDVVVSRNVFLQDERLAGAEVIREPWSSNPSFLTTSEAAALTEYIWTVPPSAEPTP